MLVKTVVRLPKKLTDIAENHNVQKEVERSGFVVCALWLGYSALIVVPFSAWALGRRNHQKDRSCVWETISVQAVVWNRSMNKYFCKLLTNLHFLYLFQSSSFQISDNSRPAPAPARPHSTPLHSTPLCSTPLHSAPLHSTSLHSTPLHSTPFQTKLLSRTWKNNSPFHSSWKVTKPLHETEAKVELAQLEKWK